MVSETDFTGSTLAGDNGGQARNRTDQARDWARSRGEQAQDWARSRGEQAQDWAKTQLSRVQGQVHAYPERAAAWALVAGLGIGIAAGMLLSSLVRDSRDPAAW